MLKKFCVVVMCSLLFVSNLSTASAAGTSIMPVDIQVDYGSVISSTDETITYGTLNPDEIAAYYGIDDPKEVSVTIFTGEREKAPVLAADTYSVGLYIDNVKGPNGACGAKEITRNGATNSSNKTVTKTITLTGTVSNTYSTSVDAGIDVEVASISSGVGFDVTDSWSMSDATQVDLEPYESVMVYAYPLYDVYSFDVINDPLFGGPEEVGYGYAYECMGFCTVVR